MKIKIPTADVGIIVGRFQVPELHRAHCDLIQTVLDRHSKVVIFLGVSPCKTTANNPLDFETRKQMILKVFPTVNVLYIRDVGSDGVWSANLDNSIKDVIGPNQSAILYGGRTSFIPYYKGKYLTCELEPDVYVSGSEIRKVVRNNTKDSVDFRAGVIWATENQYAAVHPTVDIAIYDKKNRKVLLARKPHESLYRFVGGFADVNSSSYEEDAVREVYEETGLKLCKSDLLYIGSTLVDDWRYRSERNKIKTLLYVGFYKGGVPVPDDDIAEVKWFDLAGQDTRSDLNLDDPGLSIVETHKPLWNMFIAKYFWTILD